MRFQQLENGNSTKITTKNEKEISGQSEEKILPGSLSHKIYLKQYLIKDMTTNEETQIVQSVDSTKTVSNRNVSS